MENILVAGANGTTGKKIVTLLESSQYFNPIAMVRKENQKEQFEKRAIKTVLADLEEDVSHTVKNIDKIIFAAGSGGKNVIAVDEEGAKKLIDAAKKEKIKKFIMLSSMGVDNPEESENLQAYFQAKQNADAYLRESNLTFSIVRPGALTDELGQGKIELTKELNKSGEISRDDVAQTLVRVLHDSATINETFEIIKGETLIGQAIPN
ncbi:MULTISPECIES: SDR family oxidoreductase [unclassified Polaribacter]|uniref:SDR family oxidoreductase n=1 Tax=unclassified Polaribacter TaxID=196858 RepID=UPI0011BD8C4C|nr:MULTISPECIES: SDR family oxidoreductase [unclassified Polaribacter]TXD51740.1 SDR family oxidoreductase [Polaribacter sp. IC063]TXD58951.1 SDR family oxidoreductase [Polaribacter sp. IC066]